MSEPSDSAAPISLRPRAEQDAYMAGQRAALKLARENDIDYAERIVDAAQSGARSMREDADRSDSHRLVVEFDDGVYAVRLVHPEGGCVTADQCGQCGRAFDDDEIDPCYDCKPPIPQSNRECWVQGWYDDQGTELLKGGLELVVDPEWDGEGCLLHIVGVALSEPEKQSISRKEASR